MSIKQKLDARIERWKLLEHPFYQAWKEGSITEEALALYAEEYGAFVKHLPEGWQGIGDEDTFKEEIEHIELWEKFSADLGTHIGDGKLGQTRNLLTTFERLYQQGNAQALGALYAFETQQPETAETKLHGLREHYTLDKAAEEYFIAHAQNHHETEKLLARIEELDEGDFILTMESAELMAKALWDTLTGIYEKECVH